VAQFVGDNNAWSGRIRQCDKNIAEIETEEGHLFRTKVKDAPQTGMLVDLFLRPEAMLIQPDPNIEHLNRFTVVVKSILFDGANSQLLTTPPNSEKELLVALPQNRQYDYIQVNDKIEIGWNEQSGICFSKN
jgi:spermidine/putrescine transport system ATP-binding protein